MKSLLRSYLEDGFAWGCPVCKTAEEELRQLQGEVREKGQIPHNIRRETLKSRDTKISRSHTDYRKRERRLAFYFKRVPQPGFSHYVLWCYSSSDPQTSQHAVYMLNILFLWNSLEHTLLMNIQTKTTSPNEPWRGCLLRTFQNVNQNVMWETPDYIEELIGGESRRHVVYMSVMSCPKLMINVKNMICCLFCKKSCSATVQSPFLLRLMSEDMGVHEH